MPAAVPSNLQRAGRARRVFARLIDGQSMRAIAEAEGIGVRRAQQIVRAGLAARRDNPAEDYALLQMARLERVLDRLGPEIDAGKPAAAIAYVRTVELMLRLARDPLHLSAPPFRGPSEVAELEERLSRLDAMREWLAARRAAAPPIIRETGQALEKPRNGEMTGLQIDNLSRG